MPIHTWQWVCAAFAASLIGLSKTGIPGIGILGVAIFSVACEGGKASVGLVLPILISADVVAVILYHHKALWSYLLKLAPWTYAGIVLGWYAMKYLIKDVHINPLIGAILLSMVGVHLWRKRAQKEKIEDSPHSLAHTATMGILAGFTTMVANAAGPIMILYLLAMRLPKMEFIGTSAWYFLIVNSSKVPFMVDLGMINVESSLLDLKLIPFSIAGALVGRMLVSKINQKLFETAALVLTVLAALYLMR